MNPWNMNVWKKYYINNRHRSGLRLKFDKEVDSEIKRAYIDFAKWLRKGYPFPIRVVIYVKKHKYIRAMDGEMVSAVCFTPFNKDEEPYIKISTGEYTDFLRIKEKDDVLYIFLVSMTHELTHYYQWINDLFDKIDNEKLEQQALRCAKIIVRKYAETREHP